MNGMYEELIEKLRKNNRMSGWTHIDRLIDEAAEAIEALQQENNGWRERYDELDAGHSRLFKDFCKLRQENEQLQAQAARVREALIMAREAIKAAWSDGSANAAMDKASDALAAIDKVIGGKEDAE